MMEQRLRHVDRFLSMPSCLDDDMVINLALTKLGAGLSDDYSRTHDYRRTHEVSGCALPPLEPCMGS
jgi:hypothetical protein